MKRSVTVLEDQPAFHQSEEAPETRSHERYPEFAGPDGQLSLKKILRQILPMALYRTWEIVTDQQTQRQEDAPSAPQIAALAGRSLRTIQKNLACLTAKHLLVERAERHVWQKPEGTSVSRLVGVKDFTALYALAHEYYEWLHDDASFPPDRIFAPALLQEPALAAKLCRFENYRRIFSTRQPGPRPRTLDAEGWSRQGTSTPCATRRPPEEPHPGHPPASVFPSSDPAKEMSKQFPRRKNESRTTKMEKRDSCDSGISGSHLLGSHGEPEAGSAGTSPISGEAEETRPPSKQRNRPQRGKPSVTHPRPPATPVPAPEREETMAAVRLARQAMALARSSSVGPHASPSGQDWRSSSPARPPDHPLARTFVHEIAAPFGNHNLKGSVTRVLRIIASASVPETDVVRCLVRAYVIARNTRTIRPVHSDQQTGQVNRMPLFCTLVERFLLARAHHGKGASWPQMQQEIAADPHLSAWWHAHEPLVTPPSDHALQTPGEDHQPSEADLAEPRTEHAVPARDTAWPATHRQPSPWQASASSRPSGTTTTSSSLAAPSGPPPDQYRAYVDALLARSRALAEREEAQ